MYFIWENRLLEYICSKQHWSIKLSLPNCAFMAYDADALVAWIQFKQIKPNQKETLLVEMFCNTRTRVLCIFFKQILYLPYSFTLYNISMVFSEILSVLERNINLIALILNLNSFSFYNMPCENNSNGFIKRVQNFAVFRKLLYADYGDNTHNTLMP